MERVLAQEQHHEEVKEKQRIDDHEPATTVTAATASPATKPPHLIFIAGFSLIVLLAAVILIWRSQMGDDSSGNTNQAAATPTQTPVATTTLDERAANATAGKETLAVAQAESVDLGDALWKRDDTGDVLQIVRRGNDVVALMYGPSASAAARGRKKGDVAFEGLFEDSAISGTAYLLFSADDVHMCPEFAGDQRFKINLRLSQDGNTLSGTREDFELSNECNVVKRPRKSLTYSRLSR